MERKTSSAEQLTFEQIENEYDAQVIAEYEREKANGTIELLSHNEVWDDLLEE